MEFLVSDGICLSIYLISIAIGCMTLCCACVSDVFRSSKASRWFKVFQGLLIGSLVLGFEIVLGPSYMSEHTFDVFLFIFAVAQDVMIGLAVVLLPFFLMWLIAKPWRSRQRVVFYPLGFVYFGCGLVYRIAGLRAFQFAQTGLFVAVIVFCMTMLWINLPKIEDRNTRGMSLAMNIAGSCLIPLSILSYLIPDVEFFSYPVYMTAFSTIMLIFFFKTFHKDKSKREARESLTLQNLAQWKITEREFAVIKQLTKGFTNKEIAANLGISVNTVNNHVANIFSKMDVRSRVDLLRLLQSGPWA